MADRSLWKVSSPDPGIVDIDLSFPSGAAEDGSFPTGLDDDGYIIDAYGSGIHLASDHPVSTLGIRGSGVFGVLRLGVGQYKIILRGVYRACVAQTASLTLGIPAAQFVVFKHPMIETETGTDGVSRSILKLQVCNTSGEGVDLLYNDRVNVRLSMKNSSEP